MFVTVRNAGIAMVLTAGALLIVSQFITSQANSHGGATGIVKERMDSMVNMGKAMKSIARMLKGVEVYDASRVSAASKVLKMHSGEAMTQLFPQSVKSKHSEARQEIWIEWEEFQALAEQLRVSAETLITLSSSKEDNREKIQAVFNAIGKSCKDCHQKFRLKK